MESIRDAATRWGQRLGVFPVTIGGNFDKRPAFPVADMFTELRQRPPTPEEIAMWWGQGQQFGLALHAGSQGYTCMDFDDATVYEPWRALVIEHGGEEILARLFIVKTRHGYHAWYRCSADPQPVRDLAMWPKPTYDERRGKHTKTRIEIRGVGAYAILPPSKGYEYVSGPDLLDLPDLSIDEQELIISAATMFDEAPVPPAYVPAPRPVVKGQSERPGDWFNRTADWRELIESAGGRYDSRHGHRDHWTRPGKRHGTSITTGNGSAGQDLAKVHTPNWSPFEVGMVKDKFGFWAVLHHCGDMAEAARAVAKMPAYIEANPRTKRNDWDGSPPEGPPPPLERLIKTSPSDDWPGIQVNNRHLREVTWDAFASMVAANDPPSVFVRGGELVKVTYDEQARGRIQSLNGAILTGVLARCADWYTKSKSTIFVNPPKAVVDDMSALAPWPGIPPLIALSPCPVLGADGTVASEKGYHAGSSTYVTGGHDWPKFEGTGPDAAAWLIDEVFADFPFTDQGSKANALGLLLLPFLRPAIDGPVPFHLFDAPTPGTGKTLLAQACLFPGMGRIEVKAPPSKEEEWTKLITSVLLVGLPALLVDNIIGKLSSASLMAVVTSQSWGDRALGGNSYQQLPNRCVYVGTSNNGRLADDLVRRTVYIRLDAGAERPEDRTGFRHPRLMQWLTENHGKVGAACVAVVRHWAAQGMPPGERSLGSFEAWSATIGGVLASVGVEGFLSNIEALRETTDDDHMTWSAFLAEWRENFGTKEVTVAELWQTLWDSESLKEIVGAEGDDEKKRHKLGKLVSYRIDRMFGDVSVSRGGKSKTGRRFKLRFSGDVVDNMTSFGSNTRGENNPEKRAYKNTPESVTNGHNVTRQVQIGLPLGDVGDPSSPIADDEVAL